jgi:hypothetical protein
MDRQPPDKASGARLKIGGLGRRRELVGRQVGRVVATLVGFRRGGCPEIVPFPGPFCAALIASSPASSHPQPQPFHPFGCTMHDYAGSQHIGTIGTSITISITIPITLCFPYRPIMAKSCIIVHRASCIRAMGCACRSRTGAHRPGCAAILETPCRRCSGPGRRTATNGSEAAD